MRTFIPTISYFTCIRFFDRCILLSGPCILFPTHSVSFLSLVLLSQLSLSDSTSSSLSVCIPYCIAGTLQSIRIYG
jgi:hypothetical protein